MLLLEYIIPKWRKLSLLINFNQAHLAHQQCHGRPLGCWFRIGRWEICGMMSCLGWRNPCLSRTLNNGFVNLHDFPGTLNNQFFWWVFGETAILIRGCFGYFHVKINLKINFKGWSQRLLKNIVEVTKHQLLPVILRILGLPISLGNIHHLLAPPISPQGIGSIYLQNLIVLQG